MDPKMAAARAAVTYVKDGMTLGIGTGSTSACYIQALGARIKAEGLKVRAVPTSVQSKDQAVGLGISLVDLNDTGELDLTVDGADEVDPSLYLIKGGGGAVTREKIVARASHELIIICDESKLKKTLGAYPLPVVVIPFGYEATRRQLRRYCDQVILRMSPADPVQPFVTDDGLFILDMHLDEILDPESLQSQLEEVVGVTEVGLFIGLASRVIVGYADGHTEDLRPKGRLPLDV